MRLLPLKAIALSYSLFTSILLSAQPQIIKFDFENSIESSTDKFSGEGYTFTNGLEGHALQISPDNGYNHLSLDLVQLNGNNDFTIQCWVKTSSNKPTVILSKKIFTNKGIIAQQNPGWVLYSSGGTFGWSVGSGDRRINYERDNGVKMPINDGRWHQMTITYAKALSEFRLYYDGLNVAIYKVSFDFSNEEPLVIGAIENPTNPDSEYAVDIIKGRDRLQAFVNEFNKLGLAPLENDEFLSLIVDPEEAFQARQKFLPETSIMDRELLEPTLEIRRELIANPYTVFQNIGLTQLKPVSKIYALEAGQVIINNAVASSYTEDEKLYPADFAIDDLLISEETLTAAQVFEQYTAHNKTRKPKATKKADKLTVGVWNIWHGGIHWTKEVDGWDSRLRIVEMIQDKEIDVLLMQESYSAGDFIAAELGYYFATTSDWDYRYQGANISVLSRYPIEQVEVLVETEFNNVAVKLALDDSREVWAISNWYGMANFPAVYDFHQARFANADKIPVLFGGDFNAVPHTDGGDSPASKILLDAGFTDAFRSKYPDVGQYPGISHRSGVRIDQLYYKGKGLKNTFTETISTWPSGFPSDHYLIVAEFDLK